MNTKLKLKINLRLLFLSKAFYKLKLYPFGRWIGHLRQNTTFPFLEKTASDFLKKDYDYKNLEEVKNPPVFVMWYQGFDNLPEVVEKCIESVKKNIKNRPLILISRENMAQYVDLPPYIYEKVDSGKISKAFFSDITRAALLYKHGGTWIDSTIFISKEIPENYFEQVFYTPCNMKSEEKNDSRYFFRKTKGWNISFQGTKYKNFPLYDYLYNFYLDYLKNYDEPVDYFMTDLMISLFVKHNETFKNIIQNQKDNNSDIFLLAPMMNDVICEKTLKKLSFLENTFVHKLTYKKNWKRNIDGKQTVYDYVLFNDMISKDKK